MARACLPPGVPLMPRDRGGIGRTGSKQKTAQAKRSSPTSPQVVEAEAGAVAEAETPAEADGQASPPVMHEDTGSCDGRKRVRFQRNPPRPTGIRHVLPTSGPWTWGGCWDFPTDHPAWSRNQDGTPRELDLQHKDGSRALEAHRWGLAVAEHVAGGFKSAWPTDKSRLFDHKWKEMRTHRRWTMPLGRAPTWAEVCAAGAVRSA